MKFYVWCIDDEEISDATEREQIEAPDAKTAAEIFCERRETWESGATMEIAVLPADFLVFYVHANVKFEAEEKAQ